MLNFGNKEFRNLQEQVLQNARDIATLKGRENLQIVIVEELPEVGNPNYIYLVPNEDEEESNVYNEYIWLADEETYEKIGGVDIDLTNYVTTDTEQTISGSKAFTSPVIYGATGYDIKKDGTNLLIEADGNPIRLRGTAEPQYNNAYDLGSSSRSWKNCYLSGDVNFGNNAIIHKDSSNRVAIAFNGSDVLKIGAVGGYTYILSSFAPESNNTYDLGKNTACWKDAYIAGNISDGINSLTVANIASKVTFTQASGTFDSNGEGTILNGASISEGLYIFTYGNCQCFIRLTSTMIQSSDVTPIRVACPMIVSGSPSLGWLHIAKSGDNLTISVKDSNDHVDSGFAWTLTKTNLL